LFVNFFQIQNQQALKWFRNETEELIQNENVEITNTATSSTLKLINVKSSDTGSSFLVKIINSLGEVVSNKATLNVSCGPVFEVEPTDQKVLKDKEVKFECEEIKSENQMLFGCLTERNLRDRDGVRMEKDVSKAQILIDNTKSYISPFWHYNC